MAFDKIIDSAQLESDLTSVAAAIRAKGATAAPLNFPAGFVSAVNNIFTSSAFGYIVASFPVTATSCTCSSGGTVLEADAAGLARGQFVFEVPAAGTWTVTISNGTDTKSESVSITAAGQAATLEVRFTIPILLKITHRTNNSEILINIQTADKTETITNGSLSGSENYAEMTNKPYSFGYLDKSYELTCTVVMKPAPFFSGVITQGDKELSSISGGGDASMQNSSYAWAFEQEGTL